MRRFDGGNNGTLLFGGADGAQIQLSRDATERALAELEALGFIVLTAAADPKSATPRQWRLTMYKEGRKSATKEFMRTPASKAARDCGADDRPGCVAPVPVTTELHSAPYRAPGPKVAIDASRSDQIRSDCAVLAIDTQRGPIIRPTETHIEAIPADDPASSSGRHGWIHSAAAVPSTFRCCLTCILRRLPLLPKDRKTTKSRVTDPRQLEMFADVQSDDAVVPVVQSRRDTERRVTEFRMAISRVKPITDSV
jgi:hypothetical protein